MCTLEIEKKKLYPRIWEGNWQIAEAEVQIPRPEGEEKLDPWGVVEAPDQWRGWGNEEVGSTNPNLGEDTLLLEGAGDERLELHHLPGVIVHPRLK